MARGLGFGREDRGGGWGETAGRKNYGRCQNVFSKRILTRNLRKEMPSWEEGGGMRGGGSTSCDF